MSDHNDVQQQFEEALKKLHDAAGADEPNLLKDDGRYVDPATLSAWWGWHAGREAVVVELPMPKEVCGPDGSYMEYFDVDQIEKAIEAQGLKVSP